MSRPISYWWDFRHHKDGSMTVIVECDHPKADGRILAEFNEYPQAERKLLSAWFRKHGRPQLADQIETGEHLKPTA